MALAELSYQRQTSCNIDDAHAWLAGFEEGGVHHATSDFSQGTGQHYHVSLAGHVVQVLEEPSLLQLSLQGSICRGAAPGDPPDAQ